MRKIFGFLLASLFYITTTHTAYGATFKIEYLKEDNKKQIKEFNVWNEKCPVTLDRLRIVKFSYYDFNGEEKDDGEITVLDATSNRVLKIFKELYSIKFPIAKARSIEYYKGNDEASMEDNNSSCYNCREITDGGDYSIHSYGLAIDINPVQNPYISFLEQNHLAKILPNSGKEYINRTNFRNGMVENIVEIFIKNGFTVWGGKWNTPIDWQYFQLPRAFAQLLAVMSSKDASEFFEMVVANKSKIFETVKPADNKLVWFYKNSPIKFMEVFKLNRKNIFHQDINSITELLSKNIINPEFNK